MVPVAYMQGGGFFISVPLAVGDVVTLQFAERSLDQWLQTARKGSQRAVIPGDLGLHPLEGALALPTGPAPRGDLLQGVHATDLVIGLSGATPAGQIHITPTGDVLIGGSLATQAMVLGNALTAWLAALTVPTAMGPSGVPINAAGLPAVLSVKHKLNG
jgi:protein gp138